MLEEVIQQVVAFRDERDWQQFHSPRNLAASIVIEAAELLEVFQWGNDSTLANVTQGRRREIEEELADVAIYCLLMAHDLEIDLDRCIERKLAQNAAKYPVSKAKGRSDKYDRL